MAQACSDAGTPRVFRTSALGTTAELVVTEGAALVAASELLERELERIDRVASRFRDDSELSRLNARAGSAVEVSTDLLEAIEVACGHGRRHGRTCRPHRRRRHDPARLRP